MNDRDTVSRPPVPAGPGWVLGWLLQAALLGLLGCVQPQTRLQSEDEGEHDRYAVKTIGDSTTVGSAEPLPIGGVGLVEGLDGTGGDAPNDSYRTLLEDDLRKQGVREVKKLLASPDVAMVLVSAQIPPGARKGDPLDVEVRLPDRSKATSLRGGVLRRCVLFNYDFTKNLNPDFAGPQSMLKGHPVGRAEGPLLVGLDDGDEAARVRQGRIWGGGRTVIDAPLTLLLNQDQQFARIAAQIAERINETFHGSFRGAPGGSLADAQNNLAVALRVPPQYRLNLPRYLRVVRLIPMREANDPPGDRAGDHRTYRQKLADDLLDPARTVTAALRLEALGQGSLQTLKQGLTSQNAMVRFCSAEALAYLGSPSCGDELALAVKQPMLRAFALTALASLDESVCQVKLEELLTSAGDDETRYGAFRALRALDEHHPAVQGELLNDSFWLHRVAPNTPPLVHVSSRRRAEIVLFGEEAFLKPPFSIHAGEFAVTATENDQHCSVTRVPPVRPGERPHAIRSQCSLKLEDVLRAMTDLGAQYPEVVEALQQAYRYHSLSCRVRVDALPQATTVFDLEKVGKGKLELTDVPEALPAGADLGATPDLYDTGRRR
jgi:hypothetical protein